MSPTRHPLLAPGCSHPLLASQAMERSDLSGASMSGARRDRGAARLSGAESASPSPRPPSCRCLGCDLTSTVLKRANWTSGEIRGASIHGVVGRRSHGPRSQSSPFARAVSRHARAVAAPRQRHPRRRRLPRLLPLLCVAQACTARASHAAEGALRRPTLRRHTSPAGSLRGACGDPAGSLRGACGEPAGSLPAFL